MNAFLPNADATWRRELETVDPLAARLPPSLDAARKLRSRGKTAAAVEAYRAVFLLDARNPVIPRELSAYLSSLGRREEARQLLAEACLLEAQRLGITPFEQDEVAAYLLSRAWGGEAPPRAPAAYVRALFDGAAGEFDERLVGRLGYRDPSALSVAVQQRMGDRAENLRVLDAGCGTGLAAEFLRPLARELDGVDLAPEMIAKAQARGLYDRLIVGEIEVSLSPRSRYDLIFAADVFSYIGALETVLCACRAAIVTGGLIAFTVEAATSGDYVLGASGRYSHTLAYLERMLADAGFQGIEQRAAVMRQEAGKPVASLLLTAEPAYGR